MDMLDPRRTAVIVGVAQITDKDTEPQKARSPLDLMVDAAKLAAADASAKTPILPQIDSVAVPRSFSDTIPSMRSPFGKLVNPPWSVARRIRAQAREFVYPPQGGDTPQLMVERACDRIAAGEIESALVLGAEALRTERNATRAGLQLHWGEDAPMGPDELGGPSQLYLQTEVDHGMRSAIAMYALFEQSLRGRKGLTPQQRGHELGRLFASFSAVAAKNPLAARSEHYTAEEISGVSPTNRYVGFPYTRLMTANMYVDQSAALLVCSEARADEWGVPKEKRVYLIKSAHGHDEWFATERNRFDRAPAINRVVREVLDAAEIDVEKISFFDIYSCFASAIEIACDEIGIAINDQRGLTVTGGLPFFGGPGNNYVTHAIAEIVNRVRAKPGSYGLVTANGGLLTKQSAGIYSTTPPNSPWKHADDARIQAEIDAASGPKIELHPSPSGAAAVETYTVVNGRDGPERGIIVGRLADSGRRFVANTPSDRETLLKLETVDALGLRGRIASDGKLNTFTPEF
jgi:acetyl-CoA C-acetyltransferase